MSNLTPSVPQNSTYVAVAKSTPKVTFPKKEQAILLHSVETLKLLDYVKAVGDIVGPKNICFASRISNNRISIYLSKVDLVDLLIRNHPTVNVGEFELSIRRLVTPAKRIVLSNICPSIPHELVEKALKDIGLELASPISFLRAGIPGDEYNHVLSFRRQVYIAPSTDNYELQTSLVIPFENNNHRIFLSTDRMECFICKQTGHIASKCPTAQSTTQNLTNLTSTELSPSSDIRPPSQLAVTQATQPSTSVKVTTTAIVHTPASDSPTPIRPKRPCPSSGDSSDLLLEVAESQLSSNISSMQPPSTVIPPHSKLRIKPAKKKPKNDPNVPEYKISEKSRHIISDQFRKSPGTFTLTAENFIAFLENTFGTNQVVSEAQKFTESVSSLLTDLYKIYPFLTERSLKNRFTRLSKKLSHELNIDNADLDSVNSQSSQDVTDEDFLSDTSLTSHNLTN